MPRWPVESKKGHKDSRQDLEDFYPVIRKLRKGERVKFFFLFQGRGVEYTYVFPAGCT